MTLPPVTPPTLQVTAVFEEPVTVAVNCFVPLIGTVWVVEGEIVTLIGAVTVAVALPLVVPSALLVAVIVTCGGLGMLLGAT